MNIIIPSGQGGMFKPRKVINNSIQRGLNIINRQFTDILLPGPSYHMKGLVGYDILDAASGIILKHVEPDGNLILNVGKDKPFSYEFANCFLYGHLSTDTATPAATDTSMAGWVKQTNTYGAGDGSTTVSGDTITLTRSFVFTAETGDVTFTKFYSSPTTGSSASPFNEILFATPITLASGQQAKVTMSLAITITPHTTAATYAEDVIGGVVGSTGISRIPYLGYSTLGYYIYYISSNGATNYNSYFSFVLEPSRVSTFMKSYVATQSTLVASADTGSDGFAGVTNSSTSVALNAYTNGSCTIVKTGLMDLSDCNVSGIRSVGFNSNYRSPAIGIYQFLSDTAFAKLNTQKLTMNFVFSIS